MVKGFGRAARPFSKPGNLLTFLLPGMHGLVAVILMYGPDLRPALAGNSLSCDGLP